MQVKQINSKNRYYEEIINIYYNWWGKEKNKTLKDINDIYSDTLEKESLPNLYALIINDTLIGTYELNEKDGIDNEKYTPYLANVYIKEQYRHQNYSKLLIEDAKKRAKSLNYDTLYLHSRIENYYEKYNFKFLKEVKTPLGQKRIYKYNLKSKN